MSKTFDIDIYVRFCETDANGHVNNVSHFMYMEEARTRLFEEVHPNRDENIGFILASIKCDYIEQSYFRQTIRVRTYVKKLGNKSFVLGQTLLEKDSGRTIAEGEAVMVCFSSKEQKSIVLPPFLRQNLEEYMPCTVEANN